MRPLAAPQWCFASQVFKAKSRYAHLQPKGEALLCSSSMQGRTLATLVFDPRVTPHYLCLSCESKSELSPLLIQAQSLATLAFASLCLISLQGLSFINILVNSILHPRGEPEQKSSIIALYYIMLLLLSIYISSHL